MSSHDSMMCRELGGGVFSGLEGAQMVVRVRGERSDYGGIDTL